MCFPAIKTWSDPGNNVQHRAAWTVRDPRSPAGEPPVLHALRGLPSQTCWPLSPRVTSSRTVRVLWAALSFQVMENLPRPLALGMHHGRADGSCAPEVRVRLCGKRGQGRQKRHSATQSHGSGRDSAGGTREASLCPVFSTV